MRYVARGLAGLAAIASYITYVAALPEGWNVYAGFVLLTVGYWLNVLVHEAGHALAAGAVGWQIKAFVVAPIGFQVANRDLAFLNRAQKKGRGGWVLAIPSGPHVATRARTIAFVAGGPVASLLAALIFVAVSTIFRWPLTVRVDPALLWVALGLQSFSVLLGSIIPYRGKAYTSDGAKIVSLIANRKTNLEVQAIGWIATLLAHSVRLRDLPEWMIDRVREHPDESGETSRWLDSLRAGRSLDAEDPDGAQCRVLLNDYRAQHGTNHWLAACDAYLAAVYENDLDRARASLDEVATLSPTPELTLAAEAAVAMRVGDKAGAQAKIADMIRFVREKHVFPDHMYRDIRRQIEAIGVR